MTKRPSIIFIFSDEHAQNVTGCYGDKIVATPNIDRIAANGVTFDNAYTPSPLCVPARMSLLTGRLPSSQGCLANSDILASDIPTFPQALSASGYETVCVGRLHSLGPDQLRGYDKRLVGDAQGNWLGGNVLDLGKFDIANQPNRQSVEISGPGTNAFDELDEAVTDAAVDYLRTWASEKEARRPFLMTVGYMFPHHPYVARPDFFERYRGLVDLPKIPATDSDAEHEYLAWWRKHCNIMDLPDRDIARARTAYYAMVAHMDAMIGRITAALAETGLEEEVLVIYSSDHGEQLGDRGLWWKQTMYDQSAKVPLVMSMPGHLPKGERRSQVVNLVDLASTIIEVAGADPLPNCDGVSFLNVLRSDDPNWIDLTFSEYYSDGLSPWAGSAVQAHRMMRFGKWKYIYYHGYEAQLFDLEADPQEMADLIAVPEFRGVAEQLRKMCLGGWDPERLSQKMKRTADDKRSLIKWSKSVRPADQFRYKLRPDTNELSS